MAQDFLSLVLQLHEEGSAPSGETKVDSRKRPRDPRCASPQTGAESTSSSSPRSSPVAPGPCTIAGDSSDFLGGSEASSLPPNARLQASVQRFHLQPLGTGGPAERATSAAPLTLSSRSAVELGRGGDLRTAFREGALVQVPATLPTAATPIPAAVSAAASVQGAQQAAGAAASVAVPSPASAPLLRAPLPIAWDSLGVLGQLARAGAAAPAAVPTLGGRHATPHRTRWATAWPGSLLDAHCGLCGIAHAGGWAAAPTHLAALHPAEWAHIQATGGLEGSDSMGCACGYVSYSQTASGGWNRVDVRWHRLLHTPGGARRPGGVHSRSLVCALDGCTHPPFRTHTDLTAHQEGAGHLAIPYYCPLTSEHCRRAPCAHSAGGAGGPLVGRQALRSHLFYFHRGHFGSAAGLDLSWGGLTAYRYAYLPGPVGAAAEAVAAPVALALAAATTLLTAPSRAPPAAAPAAAAPPPAPPAPASGPRPGGAAPQAPFFDC